MRVIAGTWKGRVLKAPAGDATRPTTDRVKESLFSILGDRMSGAVVLDLCCGAGGLGIEALSRGAVSCTFVDRSPEALTFVRRNLESLGVTAERWSVVRAEAHNWFVKELGRPGDDLAVFADPPYSSNLVHDVCRVACVPEGRTRLLILEHEFGAGPDAPSGWILDRRHYGRSELSFMERES